MTNNKTPEIAFARARWRASQQHAYLSEHLYAAEVVGFDELPGPVYFYGDSIEWSRMHFSSPNEEAMTFSVGHELGHFLFDTETRANTHVTFDQNGVPHAAERNRFYKAACLAINSWLRSMGIVAPPNLAEPGALEVWRTPSELSLPEGKTAEFYYDMLPPSEEKEAPCPCSGRTKPGNSPAAEAIRQSIAANGLLPGDAAGEEALSFHAKYKPSLDWRKVLPRGFAHAVNAQSETRRTFTTLSKRQDAGAIANVRMAGERDIGMPAVAVILDSSGSVDDEVRSQFASTLRPLLNMAKIYLVVNDADVQSAGDIETWRTVVPMIRGGGGTDFTPAIEHLQRARRKFAAVYIVTDGFAHVPPSWPLRCPVYWCVTHDGVSTVPWGTLIRMSPVKR